MRRDVSITKWQRRRCCDEEFFFIFNLFYYTASNLFYNHIQADVDSFVILIRSRLLTNFIHHSSHNPNKRWEHFCLAFDEFKLKIFENIKIYL